jgi:hypothetical protein
MPDDQAERVVGSVDLSIFAVLFRRTDPVDRGFSPSRPLSRQIPDANPQMGQWIAPVYRCTNTTYERYWVVPGRSATPVGVGLVADMQSGGYIGAPARF